jgi:hypothetical protein
MIQFNTYEIAMHLKKLTRDQRIREVYTNYPVWLFYWWKFESRHKDSLKTFRKTIALEDIPENNGSGEVRTKSSAPMIEVGKIIDKYKTWKD